MKNKKGFTLIEVVTVLAIVAALAVITTVAVSASLKYFRQVAIVHDIAQITAALEIYKQQYGEYPPDGTDRAAIERHIKKRWVGTVSQILVGDDPIMTGTSYPEDTLAASYMSYLAPLENNTYFNADGTTRQTAGAERSLSFWLCGLGACRVDNTGTVPAGKAAQLDVFIDILNDSGSGFPEESEPILELKNGQNYIEEMDTANNWSDSWLTDSKGNKFIYFRAGKNGYNSDQTFFVSQNEDGQENGRDVFPLSKENIRKWLGQVDTTEDDQNWFNPDSYQLIFAGRDGDFGTEDDVANFSNGKTLGDL